MRITTDVNSAGLRPPGNVSTRLSSDSRSLNVSDAKSAQDVIIRMQREKSLIDALAIAQSSRELVMKALNISSRLMSLASEAMVTGRINMDELTGQMTSINGEMGNYGERVSVPVEGNPVPVEDVQLKLDESIVKIRERAAEMISGKAVPPEAFESVVAQLNEIASEFEVKVSSYSAELGNVKLIGEAGFNYTGLNKSTADLVIGNPVRALDVQGNISYEMAGKLTMA